jgi:hypothetical protein
MSTFTESQPAVPLKRWKNLAPIAVLIFLSPVIAELLTGTVHLTNLWLLLPEMGVYGFAALMIREVVRRKGSGWGTILLLGIAFAIAEECVILQTSLTPQFFPPDFEKSFGWANGVQWIYLLAILWYESVYAIVFPIYLTEVLFPLKRDSLWLSRRGLFISGIILFLASIGVWQLWSRVGLQRFGPTTYQVPPFYIVAAVGVITILVIVTLSFPKSTKHSTKNIRRAPAPWLVGILAFGFGLVWFLMIGLAFIPAVTFHGASPIVPMAIGLVWIGVGLSVVSRISTAANWQDRHRLALIFGAIVASMVGGTMEVLKDAPVDIIGKFVLDLIATGLFIWFSVRVRKRRFEIKQPESGPASAEK